MTVPTVSDTLRADPRSNSTRSGERASISAIVLTFNEERNLAACLASLAEWVDEVFVVDSGSTDRTVEIARLA